MWIFKVSSGVLLPRCDKSDLTAHSDSRFYRNQTQKPMTDLDARLYTVISHVDEPNVPDEALRHVVKMGKTDRLVQKFGGPVQCLRRSKIPAADVEPSSFQSLHFDGGQPLFPRSIETLYLYTALYCPRSTANPRALTRLASIKCLLTRLSVGNKGLTIERLRAYGASHGSGWDWEGDSGNRISCFARVLDALTEVPRLTNFRQTPASEWYSASIAGNEFRTRSDEAEFYRSLGIRLEELEVEVVLRPGDLLILNNMKLVHGRCGKRRGEELHQLLYGVQDVPAETASAFRDWLVDLLPRS